MSLIGSGRLSAGQSHYYDVVLSAYVTYAVYVRPHRSGTDFDLRIYDENGNLVHWDESPDSDALCLVTPRWTGLFRIMVICAAGASTYNVLVE
jgi:hypothetical protein